MSPIRIETQDAKGNWNFVSFVYDTADLAELINVAYQGSKVRIYDRGTLTFERNEQNEFIDYRIN